MAADNKAPILFWVQHLLGIGHVVRVAALARVTAAAGYPTHVATGGFPVQHLHWGRALVHPLPVIQATGPRFGGLSDAERKPIADDVWLARETVLSNVLEQVRPQLLVLEHYPFGRRRFRHEISALISAARSRANIKIAISVRDILVDRRPERWKETADFLHRLADAVFVHGDRTLATLDETYPFADQCRHKTRYTGFIDSGGSSVRIDAKEDPEILISTGGGNVGALLRRAAATMKSGPNGENVRIRIGRNVPEVAFGALKSQVDSVIFERNSADYRARMAQSICSVSQAGYNTVVDLLITGVPAVLVPFEERGETEQLRRAEKLSSLRRAVLLRQTDVTPDRLREAIGRAIALPPALLAVNLNGAAAFVAFLPSLLQAAQ